MGNVFIAFCFYFALKRQHDSWNPNILRLYGVIKNTPCVCIITAGQPEPFGYDSIKEHPSKSRRAVNYFENQNPPVYNAIIEHCTVDVYVFPRPINFILYPIYIFYIVHIIHYRYTMLSTN